MCAQCWELGRGHAHLLLLRQPSEGIKSFMPLARRTLRSSLAAAGSAAAAIIDVTTIVALGDYILTRV